MSDPIPVNLARIEQKTTQTEASKILARQVASQDSVKESMEEGFNPAAVEREQGRMGKFRPLTSRHKPPADSKKIEKVGAKAEEDLAQNFQKRNPELPPDKLTRLKQNIPENATPEEILEYVQEVFKDPTLADEAMEYLEHTSQGDLKEAVKEARAMFFEQKGREIIAGRNVDSVAKAFHKKGLGQDPTELRDLYRSIIGEPRDHNVLFSELSESYPFDQLKLVVAFLLKGMGYDLKSKGPSIPQAELMRLMTELRNLQSILWVYLFFKGRMKLVKSMFKRYQGDPKILKRMTFEWLAKIFIKIVEEKYPNAPGFLKATRKLGFDENTQIILFTQFRDAIRGLSPRIYRSVKHRQDLLLVILEILEELEEEEEEEE